MKPYGESYSKAEGTLDLFYPEQNDSLIMIPHPENDWFTFNINPLPARWRILPLFLVGDPVLEAG